MLKKQSLPKPKGFSVRERRLDFSHPQIMGILNVTPDSFSDGGRFNEVDSALNRIERMAGQGATIIDIGGESTRPGSEPVVEQEELDRVMPILEKALSRFPDILFSIDTTKYRVAEEALKQGVHLVNDIRGLQKEPRLADLCVKFDAGYIMMHSQGDPKTMQENPTYKDVVGEVYHFFEQQLKKAEEKGLDRIIIDPGFGFGKTLEHNLKLLANLHEFKELGCPIMVGASRKSMIGAILDDRPVNDRVVGTVAVHYHAMMEGANIIRVHDVQEARDSLLVYNAVFNYR